MGSLYLSEYIFFFFFAGEVENQAMQHRSGVEWWVPILRYVYKSGSTRSHKLVYVFRVKTRGVEFFWGWKCVQHIISLFTGVIIAMFAFVCFGSGLCMKMLRSALGRALSSLHCWKLYRGFLFFAGNVLGNVIAECQWTGDENVSSKLKFEDTEAWASARIWPFSSRSFPLDYSHWSIPVIMRKVS